MEGTIFVNQAFTIGLQKYLNYKDTPENAEFSNFLVIVIRALILIYGELDIVNPYRTNNQSGAGGFDDNLKKFGLSDSLLMEFKQQCLQYFQNEQNLDLLKLSFLNVQRILIDMFALKSSHVVVSDEEKEQFKSLLYMKEDTNASKNELYLKLTPNSHEIANYFSSKMFEQKHNFVLTEYKDVALDSEAYRLAGYNIVEIMNMSEQEILNINNKVYHFFRIKETDTNKKKRLESAILYYKKYGNAITTGNGYVDMLLLSSIIATGLMVAVIVAMRLVG